MEQVTWYDAVEFCNRLSDYEGLTRVYTISGRTPTSGYPITSATVTANFTNNGYRLPTEAEWEYACRAGTTGPFSTGNNITTSQANYNGVPYNGNPAGVYRGTTTGVGSFPANPWRLYDMHGNVSEWCWDRYVDHLGSGAQTDPAGPETGSNRVARGGSFYAEGRNIRSARRYEAGNPSATSSAFGIRLVRN